MLTDLERQELKNLFLEHSKDGDLYAELKRHYTEPQRFYHIFSHLLEMFRLLRPLESQLEHPEAVFWAVWFHDSIYDPRASDNEEESAQLALERLTFLEPETLERVSNLILCTKTHQALEPDGKFLMDADLSILGSSFETYANYARAIRKEYEFVPLELYCSSRIAVLERFLNRSRIYQTLEFGARFEAQARQNLTLERQSLLEGRLMK